MKPNSAKRLGEAARSILFCVVAAALQSCAPPPAQNAGNTGVPLMNVNNLTYNGANYGADEKGWLAAQKANEDSFVAQLATESDPIKGRALVVLPDHDRLRPLVAQQEAAAQKHPVAGRALDVAIDRAQMNLGELSDSIVKNAAFQTVTVSERNDVVNIPTTNTDYVIVYEVRTLLPNNTGNWIGVWLVRRVGNSQALVAAVDQGTPVGTPRLASFVKSAREDALRLGGTTIKGETSASLPAANGLGVVTSGSGIVVDKQGGILTNAHVVGCPDPTVIDANNTKFPAHVVTKDQANDLAFLRTEHHWPQAATFRDGADIRVGENVFAVGFPLTGLVSSSSIVTTGSVNAVAGPRDDSRLMQISAPIQPGNSGGAVLDNEGHVIGVVTSELNGALLTLVAGISPQNVNFALKAVIARNFLASQDVEFTHAPSSREMSSADVSALARKISVRVQCGG